MQSLSLHISRLLFSAEPLQKSLLGRGKCIHEWHLSKGVFLDCWLYTTQQPSKVVKAIEIWVGPGCWF